jgi:acetylornithine deacetylase/succinyl-diaminopimelate desuccinylase-like protein
VILLLVLATLAGVPSAGAADWRAKVQAHVRANEAAIFREFVELLSLPNLASDTSGIRQNADHILKMLERRGVSARLLDGEGGPSPVYGELLAPGARRTVIFYAHYDGQPVDAVKWASPPWTPVLRDKPLHEGGRELPLETAPLSGEWRLYARSTGDDKAPIVGFLAALDALKAASVRPSVNLKFFLEGEEEAGSSHMAAVLDRNREILKADAWVLCDGPVHQTRRMQVFFGARGVMGVDLTVYGPLRALHSGHYGNWAPNPAVILAELIAGLRDSDGRIKVAGFYDDVRPVTEAEKKALSSAPDVDASLRAEFGLFATEAGGARLVDRLMLPAMNVRGMAAGAVGSLAANAIPTEAAGSIDFRLVPDQTPEKVRARVEAHLRSLGYTITYETPTAEVRRSSPRLVKLDWEMGYPPARTDMDLPFSRAVVRVAEEAAGGPVVILPTLGGSVPMHLFAETSRVPIVGIPIANHDNNQHAANENIRLQNLWDGIVMYAGLFARLGVVWGELQLTDRGFRARDLELAGGLDVELLDCALLEDHGEALVALSQAELRSVHLQAELAGEIAVAVGQHHDLARGALGLAPGVHHERVVHGHARDEVDTLGLEGLGVLDVPRKVLVGACRCERPRDSEEHDLLAGEELLRRDGSGPLLGHVHQRRFGKRVTHLDRHRSLLLGAPKLLF